MKAMTPALAERLAARFAALADPARLRLLHALHAGERPVLELAEAAGLAQPATSRHLAVLRQAGLVEVRRAGNQAFYRVRDPTLFELCALVCAGVQRAADEDAAAVRAAPPTRTRRTSP